jgi:hypothetical protein
MGRTLHELGHTMTSDEFGLHLALENARNAPAAAEVDPEMQALFGA